MMVILVLLYFIFAFTGQLDFGLGPRQTGTVADLLLDSLDRLVPFIFLLVMLVIIGFTTYGVYKLKRWAKNSAIILGLISLPTLLLSLIIWRWIDFYSLSLLFSALLVLKNKKEFTQ